MEKVEVVPSVDHDRNKEHERYVELIGLGPENLWEAGATGSKAFGAGSTNSRDRESRKGVFGSKRGKREDQDGRATWEVIAEVSKERYVF